MAKHVVRPHIEKLRPELERFVRAKWNDPKVLGEIEFELTFRHKRPSVELREKVSKRLNELKREPIEEEIIFTDPPSRDLLDLLGYRAGVSKEARRAILTFVYTQPLSYSQTDSHLRFWGEAFTDVRLKKIADTLSDYIRVGQGKRDERSRISVGQWREDLEFLKSAYYDLRELSFTWPRT